MIVSEIISEAEYADIIITLMKSPYKISSITKLVFIAFCVKHESNLYAYHNRTKDFVDVFFSNISLKFSIHYQEIGQIIHTIDMLNKSSKVLIDGDYIELKYDFDFQTENKFLKFCITKIPNPIIQINKLDAKAVVEEVLRYV
ncbi:MAG TPA: hypothetical protein DD738_06810 [Ruminiclostridium sp.]|jgi:hypothetical protein|nr:hypothetical protein [Ruminiclostridium sp.]